jgi:DNA processing protein
MGGPVAAVGLAPGLEGGGSARPSPAWSREERHWWLLWSRCPGLGWVRLQAMERACGGLAPAWGLPVAELTGLPGWQPSLGPTVEHFRRQWGEDPLALLVREPGLGRKVLLPGDRRWPAGIRTLERPPLALWWQGRGSLWPLLAARRAVAVVGTRRPSQHGLSMARSLGMALARSGWPVVSGLAEGIDGAVHGGCLAGAGAPVAVLGTPLERTYPQHHTALQAEVGRRGLLVTEQAAGTPVRRGHFAGRNRLLVALATAVVVVECPPGSGALHSADFAWRQGLPLWVVPADAGRASALGSNRLLARGATPLLTPEDLVASLGPGPLLGSGGSDPPPGPAQGRHRRLLQAVGAGASLDQLCQRLGRPAAELALELLDLECTGLLQAEPGLWWHPC